MLRNLTDIFPGLRWTTSNQGRTATATVPLAGPIELSLTPAGSIAMRLPEDGLFKKELTLSPDSAVAYLDRWAADHYAAIESAMGLRPRAELESDLTAQLAAARVAVEKWRFRECCAGCGEGGNENAQCYTDAVENDAARTEARRAVGLEG